ncbi:MAG TPA: helix-turn-helix domain-containing protein [Solirubrobacterales bacterium]|nr:helix-turn-helix domain-containing protein [Solirubrobacterales bacterium]
MRSSPPRRWSTAGLPESEQFGYWHSAVWEAFVPVTLERSDDGPFPSAVNAQGVGPLGVSRIVSNPQKVARTADQVRAKAGDIYFCNLPLSPGSWASQDGRRADLAAGDLVIVDGSQPFELGFERAFDQVSIALPHDLLAPLLATPTLATAVRVRGDQGVGAIAGAALRALAAGAAPLDAAEARAVADQVSRLLALSLGRPSASTAKAPRVLLLAGAIDEIERRLADPELAPGQVAERIGVSTRYLHQLFSERGLTFGRHLLARRLEQCRRDLGDPEHAHESIGEIAWNRGFQDPSHFGRAFKARYGLTPGQCRSRARADGRPDHGSTDPARGVRT